MKVRLGLIHSTSYKQQLTVPLNHDFIFLSLFVHNGLCNLEGLCFALLKTGISYFSKENFERLKLKSCTVYFVFMILLMFRTVYLSECLMPGFPCKFWAFCFFLSLQCDPNVFVCFGVYYSFVMMMIKSIW